LRIPVAVEAPGHLERFRLLYELHPVDPSVTGDAADSLCHVDGVVEIDEVGRSCTRFQTSGRPVRMLSRTGSASGVLPDDLVAVETGRRGGCARTRRSRRTCGSSGSRCPAGHWWSWLNGTGCGTVTPGRSRIPSGRFPSRPPRTRRGRRRRSATSDERVGALEKIWTFERRLIL